MSPSEERAEPAGAPPRPWVVWLARKYPGRVLLFWIVLGMLAAGALRRIDVDTSLEALLPPNARAVEALEELRRRVPSSSPLYLLVSSSDPSLNRALARRIAAEVRQWPESISVLTRRDPTYFLHRALLYLPTERLAELAEDAEALEDFRRCAAIPGCFQLEEEPTLPSRAELRSELSEQPEVQALLGLIGQAELPSGSLSSGAPASGDKPGDAAAAPLGDLCSPDGRVCSVEVVVEGKATDLEFARRITAKARAALDRLRPSEAPEDLQLEMSGSFHNMVLTQASVTRDLRKTASISFGLMLLVLLMQFRGLRAHLLLLAPLGLATLVTLGVIGLVHPELNLISAFTLAVLAGLGIDFGVHMLTHYGSSRARGREPEEALRWGLWALRRPMLVAVVTTMSGFGALYVARFRGFAEMGALAALGIGITFVVYWSLFPALVLLLQRGAAERGSLLREVSILRRAAPLLVRHAGAIVAVGALLGALGAVLGPRVSFEYNFRNLQPPRVGHGIRWSETLHGTGRPAVVLLGKNPEALEAAAAALRQEAPARLGSKRGGPGVVTPASFVPADQAARLESIARLRAATNRSLKWARGADREELLSLLPLVEVAEPITASSLPAWLASWLRERDGTFGSYGLAYTGFRPADARDMERLARVLDEWAARFPEVTFACPPALIGLVLPGLRGDAPLMLGLALLGLAVGTLAVARSFRLLLLALSPLALAMLVALGATALLGIRINLYNLIVFPLAFGIGVDGSIYVLWAMTEPSEEDPSSAYAESARGVLGSTLTTTAGFGSLLVASNPGLASLGKLSIVTFLATLFANLVWQPAWLSWLGSRGRKAPAGSSASR